MLPHNNPVISVPAAEAGGSAHAGAARRRGVLGDSVGAGREARYLRGHVIAAARRAIDFRRFRRAADQLLKTGPAVVALVLENRHVFTPIALLLSYQSTGGH